MKQFLLALTILLTSCAGPNRNYSKIIHLKDHKIVITDYYVGKYSKVNFATCVNIEGTTVAFTGSNGSTGYYYKKYNLQVGDEIKVDINLILDDEHLYVEDIDFDKYIIR